MLKHYRSTKTYKINQTQNGDSTVGLVLLRLAPSPCGLMRGSDEGWGVVVVSGGLRGKGGVRGGVRGMARRSDGVGQN